MAEVAETDVDWCSDEFATINFGDQRLDVRFRRISLMLAKQPIAPINKACNGWRDTKAAYRMFHNEKVTAEKILAPHHDETIKRAKGNRYVLGVQDTTYLNFDTHKKTRDLGLIGETKNGGDVSGLMMHTTMAFCPLGKPLGILAQKIFSRAVRTKLDKQYAMPIQDKDSYRWIESFDEAKKGLPEETKLVMVGDREADMYELFTKAHTVDAGFLVRASWDRVLEPENETSKEKIKVLDVLSKTACSGRLHIKIPGTGSRKARSAELSIRHTKVTLKPPARSKIAEAVNPKLEPIEVFVVSAVEENPPGEVKPLDWVLFTNIPVSNFEDATQRIDWYKIRWKIEEFHRVLKSGCTVEACRLGTAGKLKKYLSLMSVIAWRILWVTLINRHTPDLPATEILSQDEYKALSLHINRTDSLSEKIPTVREAVRWIAMLGGFLARKGDKEPGTMTIWRGWQRMNDITETYVLLVRLNRGATCG